MTRRKRDLIRLYRDMGYREVSVRPSRGGHYVIAAVTPSGTSVRHIVAATPSDKRAWRNMAATARAEIGGA